jgi:Recombination protein O N terminal/Recombination protein O C terminal
MSPPVRFHALVLKSYETGNSSEVVHTISADYGRLSIYARGLKNPKNQYRGILQPLSLVEMIISLKGDAEMGTLREATLLEEHEGLRNDLERLTLGMLLAEVMGASCGTHQPAPELFSALLHGLHHLDPRSGFSASEAACRGMVELLSTGGYGLSLDPALLQPWPAGMARPRCFWLQIDSGFVSLEEGAQPAKEPSWPWIPTGGSRLFPLPPSAVRFIYQLERGQKSAPLDTDQAHQFLEGTIRLCEYHLEVPLQSARFWRQLCGVGHPQQSPREK